MTFHKYVFHIKYGEYPLPWLESFIGFPGFRWFHPRKPETTQGIQRKPHPTLPGRLHDHQRLWQRSLTCSWQLEKADDLWQTPWGCTFGVFLSGFMGKFCLILFGHFVGIFGCVRMVFCRTGHVVNKLREFRDVWWYNMIQHVWYIYDTLMIQSWYSDIPVSL